MPIETPVIAKQEKQATVKFIKTNDLRFPIIIEADSGDILKKGEISEGLCIMHVCDNPRCCNPNHLRLGTVAENNQDCIDKGRKPKGENHPNNKLTDKQVAQIREKYSSKANGVRELARIYGISPGYVSQLVSNKYRYLPIVE